MKKKILIFTAILSFCLILSISIYASFQAIYRKYPTTIKTTNVSFLYNDKSYLSEIETNNLNLVKGAPEEIELKVESAGSKNIVIDYKIKIKVSENIDGNATDSMLLAKAIDVYYFNGNRYEYISNLEEFNDYEFSGVLLSNNNQKIKLELMYNAETSTEYDLSCSNHNVKIETTANAEISTEKNFYRFVSTENQLRSELEKEETSQIFLLNDITINSKITTNYKHGIDLNGYTLTLKDDIDFETTTITSDDIYIGSKSNGSIESNNDHKIIINSNDIFYVNNSYLSYVKYENNNAPFGLNTVIKNRMDLYSNAKEYLSGDDFPILDDLWGYSDFYQISSDVLEFDSSKKDLKVKSIESSSQYFYRFIVDDTPNYSSILVRGNSLESIFESIKSQLNYTISSTVNFKSIDIKTGAHIEYYVNDGHDGNILDSNGIYQKNGTDFVSSLNEIKTINPTVLITISKGNEIGNFGMNLNVMPLTNRQIIDYLIKEEPTYFISGDEKNFNSFINENFKDKVTSCEIESIKVYSDDNEVENCVDLEGKKILFTGIMDNASFDYILVINAKYTIDDIEYSGEAKVNCAVLGKESYTTKYDIKNRLSSKFNENDYINGDSFTFYGLGALSPKLNGDQTIIYIKYIVQEEYQNFVSIVYDYKTNSSEESQVSYFLKKNDGTYQFINIENQNIVVANLNGNNTLFVEINATDLYDGDTYRITDSIATSVTNGSYAILYSRVAVINILTANIPEAETTIVKITAELHKNIDFSDELYNDLSYEFSFPVEGVIHYGIKQGNVKNIFLYNALVDCFDANNDNVITYSEAKADLKAVKEVLTKKGLLSKYIKTLNTSYLKMDYLSFDELNIEYLDGIENFSNINGYSFNNCNIIGLSSIKSFHNLVYFSANNNSITDIEPLNLLDNLKYLDLSNNFITSIDDIAYLSSLQYINFDNNKLIDFEALQNMTTIRELYLCGMEKNGTPFISDYNISYQLTLIMINCVNDNQYPLIKTGDSNGVAFSSSTEQIIAVKILHQLERINRVYKTLYLPAYYYDENGNKHEITWSTNNQNLISINNDESLVTNGCRNYFITSPIIDTNLEIIAQVDGKTFQRRMNVTVIKSTFDQYYLYSKNKYYNLSLGDLIPDHNLITAIFNTFNKNVSEDTITFTDNKGNQVSTSEKYVISFDDYNNSQTSSFDSLIDWSNYGITDLTGLDYISEYFNRGNGSLKILNLEGNLIKDLSPLTSLTEIETLRLSGKKYDFEQLLTKKTTATGSSIIFNMNNLTNLYVSKCYSLDDDNVLTALFKIFYYSNKKMNIYIRDNVIWDPYEPLLKKKMSSLPTVYTFSTLNSEINIFNNNGIYTNSNGIAIEFYGITHYFKSSNEKLYSRFSFSNYSNNNYFFKLENGILTYINLMAGNETSYLISNLIYSNNSKNITLSYNYIIQINCEDLSKNVIVKAPNNIDVNEKTLYDLFGSRELKEYLLTKIFSGNLYEEVDSTYFITLENLQKIEFTNDKFDFSGITSNEHDMLYGLRYLPNLKKIFVKMDFNAGDGADLVNLESIEVQWSYVDFSSLADDIVLENLTTLNIYSFNSFVIKNDIYKHMPKLQKLYLNLTDSRSSEKEYFDIDTLSYFIKYNSTEDTVGETTLNYLYLNGITYAKNMMKNNNPGFSKNQMNIIINLRNAYKNYFNNNFSSQYIEPSVYLGTKSSNFINDSKNVIEDTPLHFVEKESGEIYTYVKEDISDNRWGSIVGSKSTIYEIESSNNNKIFSSIKYTDFGLKINGTRWDKLDESEKIKISSDTIITLPMQTGENLFGIGATIDEKDILLNNYYISWQYWIRDSSSNVSNEKINSTNKEVNIKFDNNSYIALVGTIDAPNANYIFIYQFIVGNGDGIYSRFSNNNLRLWAFINAEISESPTLDLSDISLMKYSSLMNLGNYTSNSVYGSKILISSIDDLKEQNIKEHLISKLKRIETIELSNLSFEDFSFFKELVSVKKIIAKNSYFKIDDLTDFTALETLDVSGDLNVNPSLMTKLPSSIKEMNLNQTKCDNSLDVFINLNQWEKYPSEGIKILINKKWYLEKNIIKKDISNYLENLNSYNNKIYTITSQTDALNGLYNSNGIYEIGSDYSINWPYLSYFKGYGTHQFVSTKGVTAYLYWTQKDTIFNEIVVPFKFNNSVVDSVEFKVKGNSTTNISDLNFELIAYLMSKNEIIYEDNAFSLKENIIYSYDETLQGLLTPHNLDNFETKSIELNNISYLAIYIGENYIALPYSINFNGLYKNENFKSNSNGGNDTKFGVNNNIDYIKDIEFVFDNLIFEYYNENIKENDISLMIYMPEFIYIDGEKYPIQIAFEKDSDLTSQLNFIIINNKNNTDKMSSYLNISSEALVDKKVFSEGQETEVKFKLFIENKENQIFLGGSINEKNVLSITFRHGVSSIVTTNSFNLYVQVQKDEQNKYYIDYGYNSNNELQKKYFDSSKIIEAYYSQNNYYLTSNKNANDLVYLVHGSEIFVSGRMQYQLIKSYNNIATLYNDNNSQHQIGTILKTKDIIETTTYSSPVNNGGQSDAVSSIEGIQIFYNLTELSIDGGIFSSIEPIKALHLKKFVYKTSDTNTYTMVEDFTPLLEGSKETLISFEYASRSNTFVNDFSFLKNFVKLENVYLFTYFVRSGGAGTDTKPANASFAYNYVNLPNFIYLVNSLVNDGITVYVNNGALDDESKFDKTVKTNNIYSIKVSDEYKEAMRLLGLYANESVYKLTPALVNDYLFKFNKNIVTSSDNYVYLPAAINDKGKYYLIDYTKASNYLSDFEYCLVKADGIEHLSKEEALKKVNEASFYTNQLAGTEVLYVRTKVDNKAMNDTFYECGYLKTNMKILVGTGEKSFYIERTITIQLI